MNEKKSSLLCVLDVLRNYTDENHSLTYAQIIDKLYAYYDLEIERKTVARDIDILMEFGFQIIKRGPYGVYLGERTFEDGELLYMIDAIYSSRSMPTRYVRDIINKLTNDQSVYNKKRFGYLEKLDDGFRTDNKELFYTIELINKAIEDKKMIEFKYGGYKFNQVLEEKKDNKIYKVNPYYMINNHGKYYLVCNYCKYDNLGNYKVEYIKDVKILDEDARPVKDLPGQENFSIKKYMSEHIYMLAGESVDATLKIVKEDRISDVVDWFGCKTDFFKRGNYIYAKVRANEDALVYWALQYCDFVEIVEPLSTKKKIQQKIKVLNSKYVNQGDENGDC